jgi:hypothetical protein
MSIQVDKQIRYHTDISYDGSQHWHFKENKWNFDYLIYPNKNSDKLLILMPAAIAKNKKVALPYYHRHSWAKSFDMSVVVVSDPTLEINRELLAGWFLGDKEDYVFNRMVGHIRLVQEQLGIERNKMCFAGSSLGGYGALLGAAMLKGSLAYAENPQLELRGYKYQIHIENLSKYCFDNQIEAYFEKFPERFSILEAFKKYRNFPNSYIVQKQSDEYHYTGQFKIFFQKLMDTNVNRNFLIAEEIGKEIDTTGHTPLTFEQMKLRIDFLFNSTI